MKLWQKGTALLLLLSVLLSQMIVGYAEGVSADVAQKAERLIAFDIMTESEVYTDTAVTRAKMAAWIAAAAGTDTSVSGAGTIYADVPADHAYSGAVEAAYMRGIITKGEDGMFNPDRQVTLLEAVIMATNAMNYGKIAAAYGGYPNGYWAVASQQSLTKGITADVLNTADAIQLISNMLDADSVNMTFKDGAPTYDTDSKLTFLEDTFKVTKYKAQIDEIDTNKNKIIATATSGSLKGQQITYEYGDSVNISEVGGEVTIYVDNNETNFIVFVEMKKATEVFYDYIQEVNKSENRAEIAVDDWKYVYFTNQDSVYKLGEDVQVTYNDEVVTYEAYDYVGCFAKVIVQNGEVTRMDIYKLNEGGLVYRSDLDELRYSTGTTYENYWTGFSKAKDLQIFVDGKLSSDMYALRSNMVFDWWFDGEDKFMIVASSRMAKGVVTGKTDYGIKIDGVEYATSEDFGWYTYSNKDNAYRVGSYSEIAGETVTAYIDDNQRVRYVMPDLAKSEKRVFPAFVVKAYEGDEDENDIYVKLIRADQNVTEELTFKMTEKLAKQTQTGKASNNTDYKYTLEYLQSVQKSRSGLNFLQFTLNSKDEITKIEPVEFFGCVTSQSGAMNETYAQIGGLYAGEAKILMPLIVDGSYIVKELSYNSQIQWTAPKTAFNVYSDYDIEKNPVPDYIILGEGAETLKYQSTTYDIIDSIVWEYDDMFRVSFLDGGSYLLDEDFIEQNNLAENSMVTYYSHCVGEYPIQVTGTVDLSGNPEDWKLDTYPTDDGEGFYYANSIVFRNDNVMQFRINGQKSQVYMFYDNINGGSMKVYEMVSRNNFQRAPTTERVNFSAATYIRPIQKFPVMNIQDGDDVWFHVRVGGDGIPKIDYMIYSRNSSFFD